LFIHNFTLKPSIIIIANLTIELNAVLPALEKINGKFQPKLTKPHVAKYFNYPEIINYPKDVISHLWDVSTAYIETRRKNPSSEVYSIDDLIREMEDSMEPDYNRDEPPFNRLMETF